MDASLPYEATSEQVQNWWYHNSLGEGQQHQLIVIADTFNDLDVAVFEKAFELLVRRHESLRTCLRLVDEKVKQYVIPYEKELFASVVYDVTIVEHSDEVIKEKIALHERSLNRMHIPPLVKCCVFKVSGNTCYVHIMLHHIIADVWSASVIYKELTLFYAALMREEPVVIEPLKMQLKDYAAWQKKWLENNGESVKLYWRNKLSNLKDDFTLEPLYSRYRYLSKQPGDCNGHAASMSAGDFLECINSSKAYSYVRWIPASQYQQLLQLSFNCRSSIWSVINASLQLLFLLLANKDRILIAMPVINRSIPGTETLVGPLGGGVYVRQAIHEEMTIRELVHDGYLDFLESARHLIYDHKEMKLNGRLLRLNCDVFANFINKDVMHDRNADLRQDRTHQALPGSEFYPLSFVVTECQDGLLCNWKYNIAFFCPDLIDYIAAMQQEILQEMCQYPKGLIRDLAKRLLRDNPYEQYSETNTPDLQGS